MRLHTLALALLTLTHAGIGLAESPKPAPVPKPLAIPQPNDAVAELCGLFASTFAATGSELQKKIGKAEKTEEVPLPNRHHPDTSDLRVMYRYQDGLVSIYTVPTLKVSYLEAAVLTDKFWPASIPKLLGLKPKEVKDRFGEPDEEDPERLVYACSYETNDSLNFLIAQGKVYRLVLRNIIE